MARSPSGKTSAAGSLLRSKQVHRPTAAHKCPPSKQTRPPDRPADPDLVMLLAEPEVRLVMRADHVDEHELMAMLDAVSVRLRNTKSRPSRGVDEPRTPRPRADDDASYRSGVGIMLLNARSEVFVGRRIDLDEDAWQMPQGGINRGENPRHAALRELREEIGTDDVDILAESKAWLYYDVPAELAERAWAGRWRGQRQKWFVMLFKGQDSDVDLATDHPEFNEWRWVPWPELSGLAVSFKRQLYLNVLGEFATIFRD